MKRKLFICCALLIWLPYKDAISKTDKFLNERQAGSSKLINVNVVNPDNINITKLIEIFGESVLITAENTSKHKGLLSYAYNDNPSNTMALDSALSGYGFLPNISTGNMIFGVYGLAELHAASGSAIASEFTARNYSGLPSQYLPPKLNIGTTDRNTIGENITCGGTYNCSIGINLTSEGGSKSVFDTGIYVDKYKRYGIYISGSDASTPLFVENYGGSADIILKNHNSDDYHKPALIVMNSNNHKSASISQNGDFIGHAFIASSQWGPDITNCSGAGYKSRCYLDIGSNDGSGTIIIRAGIHSYSSGSVSIKFHDKIGYHSSSCIIQPSVGFLPNTSMVIYSQNKDGFSFTYINGSSEKTHLHSGLDYNVNYLCSGH